MSIVPFKLERYFSQYEFTARYLLSSSDCEAMTIGELLDFEPEAREQFERHWLGYTTRSDRRTLQRDQRRGGAGAYRG